MLAIGSGLLAQLSEAALTIVSQERCFQSSPCVTFFTLPLIATLDACTGFTPGGKTTRNNTGQSGVVNSLP